MRSGPHEETGVDDPLARARATLRLAGLSEGLNARQTVGRQASALWSPPPSLPPGRIGTDSGDEFVVRGRLGQGGMCVVELAQQRTLQRDVALKRPLVRSDEAEQLLLREAIITGRLEHPHIVPVHALVQDDSGPAVVMKRISGAPWEELMLRGEAPLDRHLEIFLQLCNAVAFAHSRGILHLDIKPANVMIGDFGEVYLVDWGLSRHVDEPAVEGLVGTPAYMAPEMARGEATPASDVFLLGATLYEALTGWPLYDTPDALHALAMAMDCAPPRMPDDVPEELAEICRRALSREPDARFGGARALRDAVAAYREHRAASDLCATAESRVHRLSRLTASGDAGDYALAQKLFGEARFAYEQAARTWPEGQEARQGLASALRLMTEYELSLHHPDAAASLLEAFESAPDDLRAAVERARGEVDAVGRRLAELERDADPSVGAPARTRAYRLYTIMVLVMTAVLAASRLARPHYTPSTTRLAYVGAAVLCALSGVVYFWRRAGWNLANRRIALLSLGTVLASLLNRIAGVIMGLPSPQVLVADALLLGLGGLALALFHPAGRAFALLCFGVAFAGALFPDWVDDLFVGLSILIPLGVLSLRRNPAGA